MPSPLPVAIRHQIVARHQNGESLRLISRSLKLSFSTVRAIWRSYRKHGEAGLLPAYDRCGPCKVRSLKLIYRAALWLKRRHPKWGAGLIRLLLEKRWPHKSLPHQRTFQRWWRAAGLNSPARRLPREPKQWAKAVHDVWQMDATSHMRLADKSGASWLSLSDEHSGAVLVARAFPPLDMGASQCQRCAGRVADSVSAVGLARRAESRQWPSLGIAW